MEHTRVGVEQARKTLGSLVTAAAVDGTVTIIMKLDIPAAAIVPLSVLRRIQALDPSSAN